MSVAKIKEELREAKEGLEAAKQMNAPKEVMDFAKEDVDRLEKELADAEEKEKEEASKPKPKEPEKPKTKKVLVRTPKNVPEKIKKISRPEKKKEEPTKPVSKGAIQDCVEALQEANYIVKEKVKGKKKVKVRVQRRDSTIIKSRVESAFRPIVKDVKPDKEQAKEGKQVLKLVEEIQAVVAKIVNAVDHFAPLLDVKHLEAIKEGLKKISERQKFSIGGTVLAAAAGAAVGYFVSLRKEPKADWKKDRGFWVYIRTDGDVDKEIFSFDSYQDAESFYSNAIKNGVSYNQARKLSPTLQKLEDDRKNTHKMSVREFYGEDFDPGKKESVVEAEWGMADKTFDTYEKFARGGVAGKKPVVKNKALYYCLIRYVTVSGNQKRFSAFVLATDEESALLSASDMLEEEIGQNALRKLDIIETKAEILTKNKFARGGAVQGNFKAILSEMIDDDTIDSEHPMYDEVVSAIDSGDISTQREVLDEMILSDIIDEGNPYYKRIKSALKSAKPGYKVFNYTDNIYASPETYTLRRDAKKFIQEFRDRFRKIQGYYRTNTGERLSPDQIDLEIIPADFSPYRKQ